MLSTILYSEVKSQKDMVTQYCIHETTLKNPKSVASKNQQCTDTVIVLYTLDHKIISSKINGKWKDTSLAYCWNE